MKEVPTKAFALPGYVWDKAIPAPYRSFSIAPSPRPASSQSNVPKRWRLMGRVR